MQLLCLRCKIAMRCFLSVYLIVSQSANTYDSNGQNVYVPTVLSQAALIVECNGRLGLLAVLETVSHLVIEH